ncbi:MAG: phosphotransferase [Alphaproteobacteria bacterium]
MDHGGEPDFEALARAAHRRWNADGGAPVLLQRRENAVFRVAGPDGGPAVLRIHRRGYHSDAALRSELAWMRMLGQAGLPVPTPIPAGDGGDLVNVEGWRADMLSWLDGEPLGAIGTPLGLAGTPRRAVFERLGALAGRLHDRSNAWNRPDWFKRPAWDLDGLTGENPLWGRPWELATLSTGDAGLLRRAMAAARLDLASFEGDYGLIHADMLPENILVADGVPRLIDFDDCGFGWRLFEVATALFWHRAEPDYGELEAALVRGYRQCKSLPETAVTALPLFMLLRGLSYVGWTHTRGQELTATLVFDVCALADEYLAGR